MVIKYQKMREQSSYNIMIFQIGGSVHRGELRDRLGFTIEVKE